MSTEAPPKKSFPWKGVLIAVLVITAFVLIGKFVPVQELWDKTSVWIESLGIWGPIAFIVIYALAAVLFVPGSALTLGAGLLFGVGWGTLWVVLGSNLGANFSFLIGRYLARDAIAKKTDDNPTFQSIDKAVGKEGWKIVGLTRLSPVFPFTLLNYGFGLTSVKWSHYTIATLIGMVPGTIMYVYLGSLGKLVGESGQKSPAEIALYIFGLLATIVVTVFITRTAKKALKEKTDSV